MRTRPIAAFVALAFLAALVVGLATRDTAGQFRQDVGPAAVLDQVELKLHAAPLRYAYPADVQEARRACFRAEREARGIPGTDPAYSAWWAANEGTAAQLDWSAAYDACKSRHDISGAKWSPEWWSNLVLVG